MKEMCLLGIRGVPTMREPRLVARRDADFSRTTGGFQAGSSALPSGMDLRRMSTRGRVLTQPLTAIHGRRVYVPAKAIISIEHERSEQTEEVEFQLKWQL